jgi:hypothetical protein
MDRAILKLKILFGIPLPLARDPPLRKVQKSPFSLQGTHDTFRHYLSKRVKLGYAIKHFLSFRVMHCFFNFGTKNNKVFCHVKKTNVREEFALHVSVFHDLCAHLS